MKIVKEYINEKFIEDSDPIDDLGIGISQILDKCIERLFNIDLSNGKMIVTSGGEGGNMNSIYIYKGKLVLRYFSNDFKEGNTRKEREEERVKYFISILKEANIYDFLENMKDRPDIYRLTFKIKNEYVKYFSVGTYSEYLYSIHSPNYKSKSVSDQYTELYEKFVEDSDPIHDMGIGLYAKRDFNSDKEMAAWIADHLAQILKMDEIPEDIIRSRDYCIRAAYCNKIFRFCKKYITVNGKSWENDMSFPFSDLHYALLAKGFKTIW